MPIVVKKEDKQELRKWSLRLDRYLETCHFCGVETDTWHLDSNTPVCTSCAHTHERSDILRQDVARKTIGKK